MKIKVHLKKAIGILLCAVLCAAGCCLCACGSNSADDQNTICFFGTDAGENRVLVNGKLTQYSIYCEMDDVQLNIDGSAAAALDKADNLWAVTLTSCTKIAEEVYNCRISSAGSAIAYETDDGLYLYSLASQKTRLVTDLSVGYYALSPNGNSVLFTAYSDYKNHLYADRNGTVKEIVSGYSYYPLALSDDCANIYIKGGSYSIYHTSFNANELQYLDLGYAEDVYYLNESMTELFTTQIFAEQSYLVKNGQISAVWNAPRISPCYEFCQENKYGSNNYKTRILPVKHLTDCIFQALNSSWNWQVVSISGSDVAFVSEEYESYDIDYDAGYLYLYDEYNRLYYSTVKHPELATLIASDVKEYALSPDGKTVCYRTSQGALYCISGGKTELIAEKTDFITVTSDGIFLFDIDDALYSLNGKTQTLLCEDVYYLFVSHRSAVYLTDDYDLYGIQANGTAELLLESINSWYIPSAYYATYV